VGGRAVLFIALRTSPPEVAVVTGDGNTASGLNSLNIEPFPDILYNLSRLYNIHNGEPATRISIKGIYQTNT
jgi:hypothetical protein